VTSAAGSEQSDPVMYPPRVVAVAVPMSSVSLSAYCESLGPQIKLHNEYPGKAFFAIADFQATARTAVPGAVRDATLELAIAYLALGLDPRKAILFRQSDVPGILELAWILSRVAQVDRLKFVATELDKSTTGSGTLSTLGDPLIFAAQILAVRGTVLPVVAGQRPLLDLVCELARDFNRHFQTGFLPIPRLLEVERQPGISVHEQLQQNISVFDTYATIRTQVKDPNTAHELAEVLARFRQPYKKWKERRGEVEEILRNGGTRAREDVLETTDQVRRLISI
jgi:tryptophanyl-tRNA synthetase